MTKETITLLPAMWDYIAAQGESNLSAGLRKILSMVMAAQQVKSISKPVTPKHKLTMDRLKLTYDGVEWYKEGVKQNMGEVSRLKREHPELRAAE
jgi:hypothetical protein